jgi:exopolysaccharide production protein ExoZ
MAAGEQPRVPGLDVLRGLMALLVALYHTTIWTRSLDGPWRTAVIVLGLYSVQGFFVISGFCFFRLYGPKTFDGAELRSFHIRRFMRIAPLFYATIALGYLSGRPTQPAPGWDRIFENVTLTFGLFHPNHALVLGGWSIGIEYVFYLVFPALAWATRRPVVLCALTALSMACAVPFTFGGLSAVRGSEQFNAYVQLGNHAGLFMLGGVLAELHARVRLRVPPSLAAAAVALAWWLALSHQPSPKEHIEVVVGLARVAYVALCGFTVAACAFGSADSIRWPPLRWLGELSYSVYLMHPFAWYAVERCLPERCPPSLMLAASGVATLALATCTRHAIELPAIALGRRWSEAGRSRTAQPNAGTRELADPA